METKTKKRIRGASDIRRILNEQINICREMVCRTNDDKIKRAKILAYLSSVALTSISNEEVENRFKLIEEKLKNAE